MSLIEELNRELFRGVRDGRAEAIAEAPTLTQVAGLRNPNYGGLKRPIYLAPLNVPILGKTLITTKDGVTTVYVSNRIPHIVENEMYRRGKDREWARNTTYQMSKLTTEHELAHVQSAPVAKGEQFDEKTVDVMETVPGYGKHRVAKALGKDAKARLIERTTPYPNSWWLGKMADWAPYRSESGEGYAAFMADAQREPFHKPLWRLAKAATRAAVIKGKDYVKGTGVPRYAPQAA